MATYMMTVEEVADYLKMKIATIYKHAQEGKIPAFKVGSKWRFKKETIDRWIADQENFAFRSSGGSTYDGTGI